ncbi:MAG: TonB-dependent receptor plug domain-containing protein [Gammaproteobacteria bacterium]
MNRTYRTPPPHRFIFVAALVCASWPAWAQADSSVSEASTIEAQPLDAALKAFALQAGMQLVYVTDLVRGRGTGGAKGAPTVAGVLTQLLAGTGLTFEFLNARTVLIRTQTTEVARAGYRGAGAARKNRNAEGTPDIEEVVVTARKREETVFDVPMAVSVLTGISLEQRGAASLTDVLQDVPSLNAIDFGNGLPSINLRGISTEAGSNEVGYYLDELPLAGIRVPLKPDVRAWDIERVEVLRGPQGTLFGEGSMGGTIRTITRDPQFNEWQTQFAMQGSHTEGGGFNEGYKGCSTSRCSKTVWRCA